MASHLRGRVDLSILRESFRRELLECLDKCSGTKAIVWDDALTGPFGLIAEYSLLKEHEVDKMFPLRAGRLPSSKVQNIIFIVRPKQSLMDLIAQNVLKEEEMGGFRKEYHIFFVPRKSLLCEQRLKEAGVYGTFTNVDEYCLDFVPFDNDLLSLEMGDAFREFNLESDPTTLYYVAKGLMTLQALYGIIPNIHGKGDAARHVVDVLLRMRRELAGSEPVLTPQIDRLLIIDRSVDPLTPLLSQLTYEGLIDENFGISNTTVKLPSDRFNPQGTGDKKAPAARVGEGGSEPKKFILNSSEELYAELRDKNFNAVGRTLSTKAKMITQQYDARHDAKTVSEMKEFVSKLPHMQSAKQSLAIHTTIAEMIKEVTNSDEFLECLRTQQEFINGIDTDKVNQYIEDCIAQQHDIIKILKLICIQCFCNNGLRQKVYDHYRREIIQTYGFQHMATLDNLEKCRLLRLHTKKNYTSIRTSLRLIVEDVNEQVPNDIAYVFSGYAPLSVRLAERLHRPGWRSITEVLNLLPGPTVEEIQQLPMGLRKRRGSGSSVHSAAGGKDQEVTLVLFLGGVTYAEISALRHLSQVEDSPSDYLIATTKVINGTSWLNSLQDTLEPRPVNPF